MNQILDRGPTYTHSRNLDNAFGTVLCISISVWAFYIYFTNNSELLFLALAIPMAVFSIYMIDIVLTPIVIFGDESYLYIKPCQPISFKKRYKFKRKDIKRTKVETILKSTIDGVSLTDYVVLITNDGVKHKVLVARNKREGLKIKKELKKWRIYD